DGEVGAIRDKPDRLFKWRYAAFRFTPVQARFPEMKLSSGVGRIQSNRRLEFALGFRQPVLHLAKNPERKVSRCPVRDRSLIKGFPQQALSPRQVVLKHRRPSTC